jgi:hypothetical protein
MPDDSTKTVELTVRILKILIHEMFTNHPIRRKMSHALRSAQIIRDDTGGFFGLRALSRIINQKLSYGHITHYFIVLISCA